VKKLLILHETFVWIAVSDRELNTRPGQIKDETGGTCIRAGRKTVVREHAYRVWG
jgi:hypothetical protein